MGNADRTLSECDYYRVGRHFLDGADAEWVASREQIAQAEAESAWEFCCEKLSHFFTAAAGDKFRILSDAELRERTEDCVRLLLQWHETLSVNARLADARKAAVHTNDDDRSSDKPE